MILKKGAYLFPCHQGYNTKTLKSDTEVEECGRSVRTVSVLHNGKQYMTTTDNIKESKEEEC